MSGHKDMFQVEVKKKNNSVKKYDIVEVYYTDLEGNNSVRLLDNPMSCEFKKSSEYCSIREKFDDKAVDLSKTEFHVITENKNITVHGWEPVYYYEEASTDLKVDASKNTNEFSNSLTPAKFDATIKSKSQFSMGAEIIQGKWCLLVVAHMLKKLKMLLLLVWKKQAMMLRCTQLEKELKLLHLKKQWQSMLEQSLN